MLLLTVIDDFFSKLLCLAGIYKNRLLDCFDELFRENVKSFDWSVGQNEKIEIKH